MEVVDVGSRPADEALDAMCVRNTCANSESPPNAMVVLLSLDEPAICNLFSTDAQIWRLCRGRNLAMRLAAS
jgi:hypothetical protein